MFESMKLTIVASLAVLALGTAIQPAAAVDQRRPPPERHQNTNQGDCAAQLNFLPRIVPKDQIAAIPPTANVLLHSICAGEDMTDFGNVGALDKTIAANPALEGALRSQGLRADDVVGIDIHNNGEAVDLYVHPQ